MNIENKRKLREFIVNNYEITQSRLPSDGIHRRNAYAHFYDCLKRTWKVPNINHIPDRDFALVMEVVKIIVGYAEDPEVEKRFPIVEIRKSSLEDFFL